MRLAAPGAQFANGYREDRLRRVQRLFLHKRSIGDAPYLIPARSKP
jgi:hypothetical protein